MANFIKNASWREGDQYSPTYFSGTGFTYDCFYINNCRTCSLTRNPYTREYTAINYEIPVVVEGQKCFCFGFCVRAIASEHIMLIAEFFDKEGKLLTVSNENIGPAVKDCFTKQMRNFSIPSKAHCVKLSVVFSGRITACTFFAPTGYFC